MVEVSDCNGRPQWALQGEAGKPGYTAAVRRVCRGTGFVASVMLSVLGSVMSVDLVVVSVVLAFVLLHGQLSSPGGYCRLILGQTVRSRRSVVSMLGWLLSPGLEYRSPRLGPRSSALFGVGVLVWQSKGSSVEHTLGLSEWW